jgi:AbrB family looped-hinge helix DNA binding protein
MDHPEGKHIFGTVRVGEKGQIVIPKEAREIFHIEPGDSLVVLGDEATGIAIMKHDAFLAQVSGAIFGKPKPPEETQPDAGAADPQSDGRQAFEEIRQLVTTQIKE